LNRRKIQPFKSSIAIHADEVKELSNIAKKKSKKTRSTRKLHSNTKRKFKDKYLENTAKKYVISSERVEQEPIKEADYKKETDDGEEELRTNSNVINQRNMKSMNATTKDKIPQESVNENVTSGKAEILIDSVQRDSSEKTTYNGKPIGMEFLYQADKLACVVKCHSKEHLLEARTRVRKENLLVELLVLQNIF
jgi:hypothetical protein